MVYTLRPWKRLSMAAGMVREEGRKGTDMVETGTLRTVSA
jgi:hypothetical protein